MKFYKYQGTGNDFILIDGSENSIVFSNQEISDLCDRRFGIGADGLIILKKHPSLDFEMDYYNADGSKSFCGNGSRCAQAFAKFLGWIEFESRFLAIDGEHQGKFHDGLFATKMGDVLKTERIGSDYFIHTGSPHYIKYVENVETLDLIPEARAVRYAPPYAEEGTNVNFICQEDASLKIRTYERGVEDETYSCGTGVTAAAISYLLKEDSMQSSVTFETKGGLLTIKLNRNSDDTFSNIWLIGPAEQVFEGSV